jgi:hypothetical protein
MGHDANHQTRGTELCVLPCYRALSGTGIFRSYVLETRCGHLFQLVGVARMVGGGLAHLDKSGVSHRHARDSRENSSVMKIWANLPE